MINSLGYTVFIPRVSEVGKIQPFRRKKSLERLLVRNLQALSEKTVHIQELIMIFKDVVNNIVDIIHSDQNTVRERIV